MNAPLSNSALIDKDQQHMIHPLHQNAGHANARVWVESEGSHLIDADGNRKPLDLARIETIITEATRGLKGVTKDLIIKDVRRNLFDGMAESDVNASVTMTARVLIEKDPNYSQVTARLLMDGIRAEALGFIYGEPKDATQKDMLDIYPDYFGKYLQRGVELNLLDSELKRFDIPRLAAAIKLSQVFIAAIRYLMYITLFLMTSPSFPSKSETMMSTADSNHWMHRDLAQMSLNSSIT